MVAASYASDLTDIVAPAFTTTNWGAFGGGASGLNAETDYYIIDSTCLSKNAWASDYRGMLFDNGATIAIPSGDAVYTWLTHQTINSVGTLAQGGLRVCMGNNDTENQFDEWNVSGSDLIIYDDRWLCAVVDPTITPDANNSASAPYDFFGAGANLPAGGPTKGAPFAIGAIRYGREFQVINGDGTGYGTFDGAAVYNDASTRRYGQFAESKGTYSLQGLFVMGTATAVDFRDTNRVIFIADTRKVTSTFNGFEVRNASSRVDWTNIAMQALGTVSRGYFEMVDNADVNIVNCTFVDMSTFTFLSNGSATGCTWRGCDQIDAGGANLTNGTVSGYGEGAGGASDSSALIWNVATDPDGLLDGMDFTQGATATHAIEFGLTSPTTMTLNNMTFTGYSGTGTSAAINVLRTTGTVTITLVGTATPSVQTAGATVEFVTNPVTAEVTTLTATGTAVGSCRVFLYATSTTGSLPAGDSVTIANSGTTATVTHTAHGLSTNDRVWIDGASLQANNGVFQITVTNANTYTYTMGSSPGSSPTGTITSTFVFIYGLSNASTGVISLTRSIPANQSVAGWARKSSAADSPKYRQGPIAGTVNSTTGASFSAVMIPDE